MEIDEVAADPTPPPEVPVHGAGLIEWLKCLSLEQLEDLHAEPIIPGINDLMLDENNSADVVVEKLDEGKEGGMSIAESIGPKKQKKKVLRFRGKRGALEIASAASGALANIGMLYRMKTGSNVDRYATECFKSTVLIPADREYFEMRRTSTMVLTLAQDVAHAESSTPWTPLLPVPEIDPQFEINRRKYISDCCISASALAKKLCQRRGHNIVGQVLKHENFLKPIVDYGRKKKGDGVKDQPISGEAEPTKRQRTTVIYGRTKAKLSVDNKHSQLLLQ